MMEKLKTDYDVIVAVDRLKKLRLLYGAVNDLEIKLLHPNGEILLPLAEVEKAINFEMLRTIINNEIEKAKQHLKDLIVEKIIEELEVMEI